ncbi:putative Leukocyte receptor cluster member 9 [Hypsibius exemplaris]|uniref:Leukocyte receptor cluster member 9 n=1 Tax=Hypsibius exemplaris TaxID=2072580 RepID=A0A1W0XAP0_HYPEX|nr:putative Leukocyte receptor cluster member 9 [Hypsibius exemplaris]
MALTPRDEIASIVEQYGNACKVMVNQGDFQYIVAVEFKAPIAVKVQFALTDDYPQTAPEIIIKPGTQGDESIFSEGCRGDLRFDMTAQAEEMLGELMLKELLDGAQIWLNSFAAYGDIYSGPSTSLKQLDSSKSPSDGQSVQAGSIATASLPSKQSSKETNAAVAGSPIKQSIAKPTDADTAGKKLPKLRTSEDVISRIMWDKQLKRSRFTVGYLDRFAGVMEDKFSAFCWDQPINAVDNDTLAIPRHRIQFFKYCGVKVWDKNERLDLVFGSDGSGGDFSDFVAQFETVQGNDDEIDEGDMEQLDDEDGDVDAWGIEDDLEDALGPTKRFQNPNRPNFFIGVRMNNPELVEKAEEIANHIVEQQPIFQSCILPSKCLHITLATVRLNNLTEINRAISTLREMRGKLQEQFPEPIDVTVHKLDSFYQNVLYGKVVPNPKFENLAEAVRTGLEKGGVRMMDVHNWVPHMTIMKINRPTQKQYGVPRTIDPAIYHDFKNVRIGVQTVETIFLCPIGVDRREDGFYQSVLEMKI